MVTFSAARRHALQLLQQDIDAEDDDLGHLRERAKRIGYSVTTTSSDGVLIVNAGHTLHCSDLTEASKQLIRLTLHAKQQAATSLPK